jgi:hypothetical protein
MTKWHPLGVTKVTGIIEFAWLKFLLIPTLDTLADIVGFIKIHHSIMIEMLRMTCCVNQQFKKMNFQHKKILQLNDEDLIKI